MITFLLCRLWKPNKETPTVSIRHKSSIHVLSIQFYAELDLRSLKVRVHRILSIWIDIQNTLSRKISQNQTRKATAANDWRDMPALIAHKVLKQIPFFCCPLIGKHKQTQIKRKVNSDLSALIQNLPKQVTTTFAYLASPRRHENWNSIFCTSDSSHDGPSKNALSSKLFFSLPAIFGHKSELAKTRVSTLNILMRKTCAISICQLILNARRKRRRTRILHCPNFED